MWETDGLLHDFDFFIGKGGACVVDKRLKEARQHGAMGLPVGCYRIRPPYPAHCEELECHWHDEMELFKVERGTVRVRCGSEYFEARAGEMVFFNSGELHAAQPLEGGPLDYTAVVFRPEMLCGGEDDIARVKYVAPVLEGRLHPQRVTDGSTPRAGGPWRPLTRRRSCWSSGPRSMSCGCGPSCWRFSLCWQRAAGRALPPGNRPQPRG